MSFDQLFDGSDAHMLPTGIAECAETLRQYNRWRRGDENIEQPHPEKIGLNIDFAVDVMDAMAGHDHLMVIAATRYCLGRMTYIVSDCADGVIRTHRIGASSRRDYFSMLTKMLTFKPESPP